MSPTRPVTPALGDRRPSSGAGGPRHPRPRTDTPHRGPMPTLRFGKYLTLAAAALLLLATAPGAIAAASDPADRARATSADAPAAAGTWQAPLSTRGRYIVDADGNRFRLKSANWDGAQGSWTGS